MLSHLISLSPGACLRVAASAKAGERVGAPPPRAVIITLGAVLGLWRRTVRGAYPLLKKVFG